MEKRELEQKLRSVLAQLEPDQAYTTREVSDRVFGWQEPPTLADINQMIRMAKALNLAAPGAPREGKAWMKGKLVHPLIWKRRETIVPEPTRYTIPPSQMTKGDVLGTVVEGRKREPGTFGPASAVRHIDPELEAIQQRIKESATKLRELEERINLLEMKDNKL